MPKPNKIVSTKKKEKRIKVFSKTYLAIIHSPQRFTGQFYLDCDHEDGGGTSYATLLIANKAAEKHMSEHAGHNVTVSVSQNAG